MRVEQEPQSRRASHSLASFAGEMISPTISMESFMDPIHDARACTEVGGMTSATGLPNLVTRSGFRVRRTCSSRPRHFALNCEIETSFTDSCMTTIVYHGQTTGQS